MARTRRSLYSSVAMEASDLTKRMLRKMRREHNRPPFDDSHARRREDDRPKLARILGTYVNSHPCGPWGAPECEARRGEAASTTAAANAIAASGRRTSIWTAEALRDLSEGGCGVKPHFANWGDYLS
jgi:hypothetical protein